MEVANSLFPIDTRELTQEVHFHSQVARTVNTIERNPASLCVKKFDLEFDVDPLFKKVISVVRPLLSPFDSGFSSIIRFQTTPGVSVMQACIIP